MEIHDIQKSEIPKHNCFISLAGKEFGNLIVKDYFGCKSRQNKSTSKIYYLHYWLCKCKCGGEAVRSGACLRRGEAISCGCYDTEIRFHNLANQKFGKWEVQEKKEKRRGVYYWLCKCECGTEKYIRASSLKSGDTTSCGCWREYHDFPSRSKEYSRHRFSKPQERIRSAISGSIRSYLKGKKNCKSVLDHLPYTMAQLKEHLESQFEPWMSWENFGGRNDNPHKTWQIDHIIPHSSFNYSSMDDPVFLECWSLSNLRPLDKIENMRKHAKIDYQMN